MAGHLCCYWHRSSYAQNIFPTVLFLLIPRLWQNHEGFSEIWPLRVTNENYPIFAIQMASIHEGTFFALCWKEQEFLCFSAEPSKSRLQDYSFQFSDTEVRLDLREYRAAEGYLRAISFLSTFLEQLGQRKGFLRGFRLQRKKCSIEEVCRCFHFKYTAFRNAWRFDRMWKNNGTRNFQGIVH